MLKTTYLTHFFACCIGLGVGYGFFNTTSLTNLQQESVTVSKTPTPSQTDTVLVKEKTIFKTLSALPSFIKEDLTKAGFDAEKLSLKEWETFLSSKEEEALKKFTFNTNGTKNNTLLHALSLQKFIDINLVKKLVEKGMDINAKNSEGETPLLLVLKNTLDERVISELLNLGADINAVDNINNNALNYALLNSNAMIKERVVKQLTTQEGFSLTDVRQYLWHASEKGNKKYLKQLYPAMKKENATQNLVTILQQEHADDEIVEHFINDVDFEQPSMMPAILASNKNVSLETFEKLKQKGIDINKPARNGQTALTLAVLSLDVEKIEYLLKNGANIYPETAPESINEYISMYKKFPLYPEKRKQVEQLLEKYATK